LEDGLIALGEDESAREAEVGGTAHVNVDVRGEVAADDGCVGRRLLRRLRGRRGLRTGAEEAGDVDNDEDHDASRHAGDETAARAGGQSPVGSCRYDKSESQAVARARADVPEDG
jgi:hypothetical protein